MSGSPGVTVSGGGSVAVDTPALLDAARVLETLRGGLAGLRPRIAACASAAPAGSGQRSALESADDAARGALQGVERVAASLRTAAERYGLAEHAATAAEQSVWAASAAELGGVMHLAAALTGPIGLLAGAEVAAGAVVVATGAQVAAEWLRTGRVEIWYQDPAVLHALTLALSSADDWLRGFLDVETPLDIARNDPSAPFGTEGIATLVAGVLWRPNAPLAVRATTARRVSRPKDLAELSERIPDGSSRDGQIRIERYDGPDGRRWIVYSAGTVTFDRDSGSEPFDMASNVRGVGDRPAESQQAILEAMRQAGVGRAEPVLLVGHSQGALNAVRIAEDGGYRVGGVVELGGPTGQIVLPDDVPRIAFEHDQDPVPHLGGVAAVAGLSRVVVRRSVPGLPVDPSSLGKAVPAHAPELYTATVRAAEASGAPQVTAFERRVEGFTHGADGTAVRYRAERVSPARDRPADAAPAPRSSR